MTTEASSARVEVPSSPFVHTLAGAISGVVAASLTQPLEVIKTRMQAERWVKNRRPRYGGLYSSFQRILREEGPCGLFVGLGPSTLALVPALSSFFTIYSSMKGWLSPEYAAEELQFTLTCAASAGAAWSFTSLLTNPLWLIRTRAITRILDESKSIAGVAHGTAQPSVGNILREILREGGYRGLYRGTLIAMAGFPAASVQFALYENLKSLTNAQGVHPVFNVGFASLVSSFLSQIMCFPLEVLRIRVQSGLDGSQVRIIHLTRRMLNREGLSSFYRGLGPSMLRTVPNTVVALVSYEFLLAFMERAFS
ncbi:hypothetical protein CCYA_CCYA18G4564 [Cyanidiococcus yangmingshanensis]|uniref:Uncharacterized protein n=1 Tax=Cyanidiococcus yangmingshanensis TaxID=2690220 RepID=A0A7J7IDY8_9RHOD|nr:hypothetical protein F1559_002434 [Cyanidiococcus yangmingshanensis]KAK4533682.1 hypothetical protein CCYA_CCYA18G4564 [Cyanidiococcus yangmingshanensis]